MFYLKKQKLRYPGIYSQKYLKSPGFYTSHWVISKEYYTNLALHFYNVAGLKMTQGFLAVFSYQANWSATY